jgi:hypothetical protein
LSPDEDKTFRCVEHDNPVGVGIERRRVQSGNDCQTTERDLVQRVLVNRSVRPGTQSCRVEGIRSIANPENAASLRVYPNHGVFGDESHALRRYRELEVLTRSSDFSQGIDAADIGPQQFPVATPTFVRNPIRCRGYDADQVWTGSYRGNIELVYIRQPNPWNSCRGNLRDDCTTMICVITDYDLIQDAIHRYEPDETARPVTGSIIP